MVEGGTFTAKQAPWDILKKEAKALILALKRMAPLIYGCRVKVIVDSKVLMHIFRSANPMLIRWHAYLQTFDFEMLHVSSEDNALADCISRYVAVAPPPVPNTPLLLRAINRNVPAVPLTQQSIEHQPGPFPFTVRQSQIARTHAPPLPPHAINNNVPAVPLTEQGVESNPGPSSGSSSPIHISSGSSDDAPLIPAVRSRDAPVQSQSPSPPVVAPVRHSREAAAAASAAARALAPLPAIAQMPLLSQSSRDIAQASSPAPVSSNTRRSVAAARASLSPPAAQPAQPDRDAAQALQRRPPHGSASAHAAAPVRVDPQSAPGRQRPAAAQDDAPPRPANAEVPVPDILPPQLVRRTSPTTDPAHTLLMVAHFVNGNASCFFQCFAESLQALRHSNDATGTYQPPEDLSIQPLDIRDNTLRFMRAHATTNLDEFNGHSPKQQFLEHYSASANPAFAALHFDNTSVSHKPSNWGEYCNLMCHVATFPDLIAIFCTAIAYKTQVIIMYRDDVHTVLSPSTAYRRVVLLYNEDTGHMNWAHPADFVCPPPATCEECEPGFLEFRAPRLRPATDPA